MLRIIFRLVVVAALAPILSGTLVTAADVDHRNSFKLTIASHIEMKIKDEKHRIDADTVLHYTWSQRGYERTLSFDSMRVKASQDGKQLMDTFMSREKLIITEAGKTTEVPFEMAPDELKKILKDSFGVSMFKLQVDKNAKEVKHEVVAGPGAKDLIDQGMIANARLFHPPFVRTQDKWPAETEISMGNGGFAKGELTYNKIKVGKSEQEVRVSGTLTNKHFKLPGQQLTMKNAKYVVKGEQTFAPAQNEWVSGKLEIDVSFEMTAGDQPFASAKGTMDVRFERVPRSK